MTPGYRVAFFGSSLVSAYWNGAATYYRGLIRALNQRGARVTFYEPDAYHRQENRDMADPDWASVETYSPDESSLWRALERAQHCDLLVKASGVGVLDAFLEQAILEFQKPGRLVAFWDVDAPATLERIRSDPGDPFRTLVPRYDLIFTYGGGAPVTRGYLASGARCCFPIYNALDETTHYPVASDPRFEAELSFLGNRLPDREARVEEFFFSAARRCPDKHFLLGGSGWQDGPMPPNVRSLGHVYTADHNAFNSTPRTVLNICRDSMARFGYSPATRLFEAAGAAACMITDAWEGIELFLEPGKEVLVAKDGSEVVEHLLRSGKAVDARQIGAAARKRVLAEHTYAHRAIEVERILEGSFDQKEAV